MLYNKIRRSGFLAVVAQSVEHVLGKDEVTSSSLVNSSIIGSPKRLQQISHRTVDSVACFFC